VVFRVLLDILYEDNHLFAVNKPAGQPSAHFEGTSETADHLAKAYLKEKYSKPGNVFLGVVHRLDKPVSGVLLFARTSKAAARLSEQFREATVEKIYWAVVAPAANPQPLHDAGTMTDSLWQDDLAPRVQVVAAAAPGARTAVTGYRVLGRAGDLAWLELRPRTGRKHQLRVQLSHRGRPIVGDGKYGSDRPFPAGIALHARSLSFVHPTRDERLTLTAEPPPAWPAAFAGLLGEGPSC
jgi:23S rRNA pseudouridine1911/1915/1917 synthase